MRKQESFHTIFSENVLFLLFILIHDKLTHLTKIGANEGKLSGALPRNVSLSANSFLRLRRQRFAS